jgi:hypothetical protein
MAARSSAVRGWNIDGQSTPERATCQAGAALHRNALLSAMSGWTKCTELEGSGAASARAGARSQVGGAALLGMPGSTTAGRAVVEGIDEPAAEAER